MLLIVALVALAWTGLSVLVVGCCVSAAQGEQFGWSGNPALQRRAQMLRSEPVSDRLPDRARRAA